MKTELYNALASLNRGFDVALESIKVLQEEGVLNAHHVEIRVVLIEKLRAEINQVILNQLQTRENHDQEHFENMQAAGEKAN